MAHRPAQPREVRLPRLIAVAVLQTCLFTAIGVGSWAVTMLADDRLLLPSTSGPPTGQFGVPAGDDLDTRRLERLMTRWDCSTEGLGAGVIPAHTVVRIEGRVSLASFDVGWALHVGDGEGQLVAVCAR